MKRFFKTIGNRKFQITFLSAISIIVAGFFLYSSHFRVMPQNAIYFMNDVQIPSSGQKLLVFSPHPDDETLGAGGYINRSIQNGAIVKIVLVTDGNKHGLKDKRYEEFRKTTATLGVDPNNLDFLNYHDGELKRENFDQLDTQFKQIVDDFRPNYIISPNALDTHPDHATTGKVIDAIMPSESNQIIDYQYLIHHNNYPDPKKDRPNMYLLPPISLVSFDAEWQRLNLSADTEKTKESAIDSYQSQLKNPFLRSLLLSFIRKNELFVQERGGI